MATKSSPEAARPARPRYEFTDGENLVFAALVRWMRVAGGLFVVAGGAGMVARIALMSRATTARGTVAGAIVGGVILGLHLLLGAWTLRSGAAFQRVVDSTGHDIPNVMVALTNLRKYFHVYGVMVLLATLLAVCLSVMALFDLR